MSLVEYEVSPRQVAADRSNAQHSTGPETPDGKARVSLNALKTGVYAKGANGLRGTLLKSVEDPRAVSQSERRQGKGPKEGLARRRNVSQWPGWKPKNVQKRQTKPPGHVESTT